MNIHKLLGEKPAGEDLESLGIKRAGRFLSQVATLMYR